MRLAACPCNLQRTDRDCPPSPPLMHFLDISCSAPDRPTFRIDAMEPCRLLRSVTSGPPSGEQSTTSLDQRRAEKSPSRSYIYLACTGATASLGHITRHKQRLLVAPTETASPRNVKTLTYLALTLQPPPQPPHATSSELQQAGASPAPFASSPGRFQNPCANALWSPATPPHGHLLP